MAFYMCKSIYPSRLLIVMCIVATTLLLKLDLTEAQNLLHSNNINQIEKQQPTDNLNHYADAPKFYHLNALLYREGRNSNGRAEKDSKSLPTPQEVALGLPRRSGESAEREDSSIDTLIRAMRRRQMGSSSNDGKVANDGKGVASAAADEADDYEDGLMGGNRSNNEANKGARKSIAPDDVSEVQRKTSSRLRSARSSNGK